jgi:hypothetical protein
MAQNISKTYRIEIQLDNARQQLADASKKLAELDAQLEGLDRGSDQAKAIVAEMAKLAAQVGQAEGQVGGLSQALDDIKPGTLPALRAEIEELEQALDQTVRGTAEFDAALLKLGNAKGELKKVEDAIDAMADTKQHAAAFVDFANGIVGAFSTATVAAEAFGLSSTVAEEYEKKLLSLITVLDSVQSISQALNSETLGVVKSSVAAAKGFLGMGEAAATGSRAARVAIASTGIGLLIVLVGALYAAWEDFGSTVKGSESNFTKFKATVMGGLQAVWAATKDVVKLWWQLNTFNFSGAKETWRNFGKDTATAYAAGRASVLDEARRVELAHEVEKNTHFVEVLKARGKDTLALEVAIAKQNLEAQKKGSKEQADALVAYTTLRIQLQKRAQDDEKASHLVFLNGLAAAEAARGADSFKQQLAAKKQQIADLNQAIKDGEYVSQAQRLQLDSELRVLFLARDKEQADKRAALQAATLNAGLARLQARGRDGLAIIQSQAREELELAQQVNVKKTQIAEQNLKALQSQAQVDKAAVKAANEELASLGIEAERLSGQKRITAIQEQGALRLRVQDAILNSAETREQQHQDVLNAMQAAGARVSKKIADDLANELQLKAMKAAAEADIFGNLLIRIFGLSDAQAQKTKEALGAAFQAASQIGAAYLDAARQENDKALADAQTRLQAATDQLSQLQSSISETEGKLAGSEGAAREYYLEKLAKERGEITKLASTKAQAAADEKKQLAEQHKLQKIGLELSAATTLAANVAAAAQAVQAGIAAVAGASAVPFPASLPAIIAAVAAVGAAVAAAKGFATATKYADGTSSLGSNGLLAGPSHAQGGIGLFNRYGHFYGEAEGGEAITPVDASRLNGPLLEVLRTKGRTRQLTLADFVEISGTRTLPPPTTHYAAGGTLGSAAGVSAAGGTAGQGQVVIAAADLSELVATNRAMLSHLQSIGAATAQTAAFGPPVLAFGHEAEQKRRELAQGMDQAESFATLGG